MRRSPGSLRLASRPPPGGAFQREPHVRVTQITVRTANKSELHRTRWEDPMKRISVALLLMLLSSTAHARGYSFSVGGHFIHVETGRHCRSLSCVSWSDWRTRRSHRDDDDASTSAPAKPVAVSPACPPVAAPAAVAPTAP